MIKVDARGCACPQPVLMTKNAMAKDNNVEVTVDNNTAKNNSGGRQRCLLPFT